MPEKSKNKKGFLSEEDISVLLPRYSATAIVVLLQEVAQFADAKIDWDALVKKTSTGISNAREYQMLWRHLAYRNTLVENLEDGAEPLDDDSDLEYELEAFPPVSSEASTEAAACVKVLIASGFPSDCGPPNSSTVEAPFTINIPNGQAPRPSSENPQQGCSTQGTNITVPVSVQKQPVSTVTSAEGLDANGSASGGLPARRKRKLWTKEEDNDLIAAVQKCGEGNWANILKGDFKGDRTASQLSQRWAIIRKRQAHLNQGGVANSTVSQLSEAQLAARRAVSLALNMPIVDNLTAACTVGTAATHLSMTSGSSVLPTAHAEASETSTKQALHQSQQGLTPTTASSWTGTSTTPKSRAKKTSPVPVKPSLSPNPMIQAAAVAAGARIANPSTAASLFKAAQSKNAFHIRPGGSLMKTSLPGGTKPLPTNHVASRPNVHYIRTGLVTPPPPPTYSGVMPNVPRPGGIQQTHGSSVRPAAPTVQVSPTSTTTSTNLSAPTGQVPIGSAEGKSYNASTLAIGPSFMEEVKPVEEMKGHGSVDVPKENVQVDQAALANSEAVIEPQMMVVAENPRNSSTVETCENNQTVVVVDQTVENLNGSENMPFLPVRGGENESVVKETCENQSTIEKQTDTPSMLTGGSGEKQTVLRTEETENETQSEKKTD